MININLLRTNLNEIKSQLEKRKKDYSFILDFKNLDERYRKSLTKIQELQSEKNLSSKEITSLMKQKKLDEVNKIKERNNQIKIEIDQIEEDLPVIQKQIDEILRSIPNIPDQSVPVGFDENDNKEIKKCGEIKKFDFDFLAHWDLAKKLNLADFDNAIKITGSRYTIYVGEGARLIRALQSLTLDLNTKAGFKEYLPPVVVNSASLYGTGQLPKFEEDLYKLNTNEYLSPTAEVQLTNLHRNEILDKKVLPLYLTASTACFRSEAGSAGRDTRGVIRQHQFYKTEMVKLSLPETSYDELESMTSQAEKILEALKLPYRRILLCTGDMGFSSAKTYDIEVWLPSYNAYKEISSCSNCTDFQARNLMIRYKDENNKNAFVHTLNGSGLAIDRLWAAVVENYQQADGSILIPDVLRKYFDENQKYIK